MAFIPPSELRRVEGTLPAGGASLAGTLSGMNVAPPAPMGAPPFIGLADLAGFQQGGMPAMAPQSAFSLPGLDASLPPVAPVPEAAPMEQEPGTLDQVLQMLLVGGAAALAKDPRLFAEGILSIRKNVNDVRARNAQAGREGRGQNIAARGQDIAVRGQDIDLLGNVASAEARRAEAGARETKADDTATRRTDAAAADLALERERLARKQAELATDEQRLKRVGAEEEAQRSKAAASEAEKAAKKAAGTSPSVAPQADALKRLRSRAAALPDKQRKGADKTITAIESNLTRWRTQLLKKRKAGDPEPIVTLGNGQEIAGAAAIRAMLHDNIPDALEKAGLDPTESEADARASLAVLEEILDSWDAAAE